MHEVSDAAGKTGEGWSPAARENSPLVYLGALVAEEAYSALVLDHFPLLPLPLLGNAVPSSIRRPSGAKWGVASAYAETH
jgi:hypothetical protein